MQQTGRAAPGGLACSVLLTITLMPLLLSASAGTGDKGWPKRAALVWEGLNVLLPVTPLPIQEPMTPQLWVGQAGRRIGTARTLGSAWRHRRSDQHHKALLETAHCPGAGVKVTVPAAARAGCRENIVRHQCSPVQLPW